MVKAWYMDVEAKDQHAECKLEPNQAVSLDDLKTLGVLYWPMDADALNDKYSSPALDQLRAERRYINFDVVEISPEKMPNYEQKLKIFYEEHLHVDEEIRFILAGSGYFDVRDLKDRWIRIAVHKNDLLILPAGIYHRFTPDSHSYTKAMRLFVEEPKWTPYNRSTEADKMAAREQYVKNFGAHTVLGKRQREEVNGVHANGNGVHNVETKEGPNGTSYILREGAQAIANYPHMRKANGFLYVSGLSSRRPDNTHVGATLQPDGTYKLDIAAQTEAVIRNIESILKTAGADLSHVVDLTCFLVDMKDYAAYNQVYNRFFDAHNGPTRTTVAVKQLPHPNLLIEIKAVAVVPK